MNVNTSDVLKVLNPKKIWIPIAFGMIAVGYLLFRQENVVESLSRLQEIRWLPFLCAFVVLLARDLGYVYRIKSISGHQLNFWVAVQVIILWEFASAVTPSVVGGTMVAVFILYKEGISFAKSLAYVMLTATFDNLFFILAAPTVLFMGLKDASYFFYLSYTLIIFYTGFMSYGLFVRPRAFKYIILWATRFKILKRYRSQANNFGEEMKIASNELIGMPAKFWMKIVIYTVFVWSARYAMVNTLAASFQDVSLSEHFKIFGEQIILWITMLISPTPGASGAAEVFFSNLLGDNFGDYTLVIAVLWRLLTYFLYLVLGIIVLPRWLSRIFYQNDDTKND